MRLLSLHRHSVAAMSYNGTARARNPDNVDGSHEMQIEEFRRDEKKPTVWEGT